MRRHPFAAKVDSLIDESVVVGSGEYFMASMLAVTISALSYAGIKTGDTHDCGLQFWKFLKAK
jgi:hypothetical protein